MQYLNASADERVGVLWQLVTVLRFTHSVHVVPDHVMMHTCNQLMHCSGVAGVVQAGASEHARELGGKGSDCHKAAVIGDTVGDPLKDTSGEQGAWGLKFSRATALNDQQLLCILQKCM